MRWFWIDRFTEFESGSYAVAVKNVSLAENHLHDHFAAAPVMPNSLIVEGFAQAGGILVAEHNRYQRRVVLAKVASARFHFEALPGDTLVYRTEIQYANDEGASVACVSHVGERLQAEVEITFAYLADSDAQELYDREYLTRWLRLLRLYDVGRTATGEKLLPPV